MVCYYPGDAPPWGSAAHVRTPTGGERRRYAPTGPRRRSPMGLGRACPSSDKRRLIAAESGRSAENQIVQSRAYKMKIGVRCPPKAN